jgi:hypothetical protein
MVAITETKNNILKSTPMISNSPNMMVPTEVISRNVVINTGANLLF